MSKNEFLEELRSKLKGLPKEDVDERIEFYSEAIDDRIEEGKTEEEAIKEIGTVDEVVREIAEDTPLIELVKKKMKPKKERATWEIVLILLGFPIWLPLLITIFTIAFVCYVLIWVLVIVTYSVELSFIAVGLFGTIGSLFMVFAGGFQASNLALGLVSLGAACLFYFVCVKATKLTIKLSNKIFTGIKKLLIGGKKNEEN